MKVKRSKSLKVESEFSIMMLGSYYVGKSSLLQSFLWNSAPSVLATIGIEKYAKSVLIKNGFTKLKFLDTSGQARFRDLYRLFYKGCHGAMVVYNIQYRESFEEAMEWVEELREKVSPDLVIALVGNMMDKAENREVSRAEAEEFAKENNLIFFETSALGANNVDTCFMALAKALHIQQKEQYNC